MRDKPKNGCEGNYMLMSSGSFWHLLLLPLLHNHGCFDSHGILSLNEDWVGQQAGSQRTPIPEHMYGLLPTVTLLFDLNKIIFYESLSTTKNTSC